MKHILLPAFITISHRVIAENKTQEEWAELESCDMFQEDNYVGGFDATEMEFCFSVYIDKAAYWFQLSLEDIKKVKAGNITERQVRVAYT